MINRFIRRPVTRRIALPWKYQANDGAENHELADGALQGEGEARSPAIHPAEHGLGKPLRGLSTRDVFQRRASVLGVDITDVSKPDAMRLFEELIGARDGRCRSVFIVNAHTLNVATDEPAYADVLNSADYVFTDGTGVRWAARQRGIELRDNLCGTDLIPEFFQATAGQGFRYFMLGADQSTCEGAAAFARRRFAGWTQVGYHHGYIHDGQTDHVIDQINASRPHMLLVGMGNPIQERWICVHQSRLRVPLAVGVGGLFCQWINRPRRAPLWIRQLGFEWTHILLQQPHKWRRYLIGNPLFLYRMTRARNKDIATMQQRDTISGGVTVRSNRPPTPKSHIPSAQIFSADAKSVSRIDSAHNGSPTCDEPRVGVVQRIIDD